MRTILIQGMGGFGNQLFQLAAAAYYSKDSEVLFVQRDKNTRISLGLSQFNSKIRRVEIGKLRSFRFAQRLLGLGLRSQFNGKATYFSSSKIKGISCLARLFLSIALSMKIKKVIFMDNLDALESIEIEDDGCFYLVGYFQTARSTDDTRVMASMRNIVNNSNRNKIQTQKRDWDSLIIHFRLGDYIGENFGILSTEYYLEALSKIDIEKKRFRIFALSDDIDRAKARHQEALDQFISRSKDAFVGLEWLDSPERTFEEDWEIMRKGDALILANSSFSWWAARLAYRRDIQVLIPQPWFRSSPTPTSIYPQDWLKIGAIFED